MAPTLAKWNRSLPFVEVLGESEPWPWKGEIDQFHVQGIGLFLDEVVFYHPYSRSLIVADLLFKFEPEGCVDHEGDGFSGNRPVSRLQIRTTLSACRYQSQTHARSTGTDT